MALPAILGQRAKAQDGGAKSDARTMVAAMVAATPSAIATTPAPRTPRGGDWPAERQVEVTPAGDTYVIVTHSHTGNTFTIEKRADVTAQRRCDAAARPRGGCVGGQW